MTMFWPFVKRALIFVHRWMGVALCLLFLLWFLSGMVMMYWDYPQVMKTDRLERAPVLAASRIRLSPQEAFAKLEANEPADRVRLRMFDGRPAYVFGFGGEELIVYADDGTMPEEFSPDMTLRAATTWTGQPPEAARLELNAAEDQWTVSEEFAALRPMRKYTWPDGEEVYVSTVTGDVEQYTTRASRMGAYFGAIPHWLYFTPLRKHARQWTRVVIWSSGLGTVAALLGIIAGASSYSPSKQFRYKGAPARLPYTGQKRWHATLGLIFGLVACTWTFSGMLSMDPFPALEARPSQMGARVAGTLRGGPPDPKAFDAKPPQEAIAEAGSDFTVKEMEMESFDGAPVYVATAGANRTRIVNAGGAAGGGWHAAFDTAEILGLVKRAAQPNGVAEARLVTEYDAYYRDRHQRRPLPVLLARMNDGERTALYIDPKTARVVDGYDARLRWNRWLYHGLHSIDLPALYRHRPAWDITVLTLLAGGTSLCATSLLMALGVLRRKLVRRGRGER